MKHVLFAFPLISMLAVTVACGGDDEVGDDDGGSSGASSSSSGGGSSSSGGSSGASSSSSGGSSGGSSSSSGGSGSSSGGISPFDCEDTPFAFPADNAPVLAAATYEDYLALEPSFPFDVVGFYEAPAGVELYDSEWGEHGGPLAFENDAGNVILHRLTAPAGATGTLSDSPLTLNKPADLFEPAYANYPPVASLPGNKYFLSYTSSAVDGVVPGLAYLFDGDTLQQRAFANGVYGPVGFERGDALRLLGHAFSPFGEQQPSGNVGAVYATDVKGGKLVGGETVYFPLFTTGDDNSGPVAKDGDGTVVLASYGNEINLRAVSRCTALEAQTTIDVAPFHSIISAGTDALAVIPATATLPGYVINIGFASPSQDVVAVPFNRNGASIVSAGSDIANPFGAGSDAESISAFADNKGYLWIGMITDGTHYVAKLRRRSGN